MSNTISARGLSFCSISLSRICITVVLDRTVIVLFVLLPVIAGWIAMFGSRMIDAENLLQLGRVHVLHVERLDDLLVVLQVVLLIVGEDEDRLLVEDLVREPVHRHDLIERLFQRDVVELQGDRGDPSRPGRRSR